MVSAALTNLVARRAVMDFTDSVFYLEPTVILYKKTNTNEEKVTAFMKVPEFFSSNYH